MSGLLSVRPGRLLIAGAFGLALAVPISTGASSGFPLRMVLAPFSLVAGHPLSAVAAITMLIAVFAVRRAQARLERLRAQALVLLVEANRRFAAAPDEGAVRRRLAEAIAELTGRGAAVSDSEGALQFKAGKAVSWRGAIEAELMSLSQSAMMAAGAQIVTLGAFHARTDGLNPRVFGAAVWVAPKGSRTLAREADHYVALLIELASAAIVRRRLASAYPAERARVEGAAASSASAPVATSGRLVTMGRFPAA
jgi:K+-sensing histidine kinase KdpD